MVDRGFVTYSNAAKTEMLGVPADLIAAHGRGERAGRARHGRGRAGPFGGAASRSPSPASPGPGGGSAEKPVGLVWFALATGTTVRSWSRVFPGDRAAVREATVAEALAALGEAASHPA